MLKSELLKNLTEIDGDFEVVFPNMEYDGLESVKTVSLKKAHKITKDGRKKCSETGTDFLESHSDIERLKELYEENEQNVIVLNRY